MIRNYRAPMALPEGFRYRANLLEIQILLC